MPCWNQDIPHLLLLSSINLRTRSTHTQKAIKFAWHDFFLCKIILLAFYNSFILQMSSNIYLRIYFIKSWDEGYSPFKKTQPCLLTDFLFYGLQLPVKINKTAFIIGKQVHWKYGTQSILLKNFFNILDSMVANKIVDF